MKNLRFKISNLKFQIFSRRIWVGISLVIVLWMFTGCSIEVTEYTKAKAPNWTSDGKIVFIKDYNYVKISHSLFGTMDNVEGSYEVLTLCEVNSDGTGYKEIAEVFRSERHAISIAINSTSSVGDWVTFDLRTEDESVHRICTIRRDGTNFNNTGVIGQNPDFSPDASKIVYEKPGEGIWIMDRDGSNDHQIIADPDAKYPAWSPDDTLIAYGGWGVKIVNLINDRIISEYPMTGFPDWGSSDSLIVISTSGPIIIDIISEETDTITDFSSGAGIFWSPDRQRFICYDGNWFVINRDGTGKWYLRP
ncbi:MAG: hypothetical protein ABIN61_06175 [candidate division WOR-3 bacterium]